MKHLKIFCALLIVILLSILATAYLLPNPYQVHYHGNFSVYIDGEMVDFSKPEYMEEIARCNVTKDIRHQDRIHLHENK